MAKYIHLGYFNGLDAIDMRNNTPEEIVESMKSNDGAFYEVGEYVDQTITDGVTSKDGKYVVTFDLMDMWDDLDTNKLTEEDACDEFIDIYEVVNE